jgi:hypothetical protein
MSIYVWIIMLMRALYNRHIGGNGGTCYSNLSFSDSFCVQCSQTSKLLIFREHLDLIYFFCGIGVDIKYMLEKTEKSNVENGQSRDTNNIG